MATNNLYPKNTAFRNLSFIKKMGLLLLACAVVVYLFLSVKFLLS